MITRLVTWRGLAVLAAAAALAACGDDHHDQRLAAAGPRPDLAALLRVASVSAGERRFAACAGCHNIRPGGEDLGGPNLYGVYGRAVASRPGYAYSAGLKGLGGRWDAAMLDRWLKAPRALVPGTVMGFEGEADPLARADLIAYLQSLH